MYLNAKSLAVHVWASVEAPQRGCHGCLFPLVHFVRTVLAYRVARVSDLSFGLAGDLATSHLRHCCSRSFKLDQRIVFSSSAAAPWTARYLT